MAVHWNSAVILVLLVALGLAVADEALTKGLSPSDFPTLLQNLVKDIRTSIFDFPRLREILKNYDFLQLDKAAKAFDLSKLTGRDAEEWAGVKSFDFGRLGRALNTGNVLGWSALLTDLDVLKIDRLIRRIGL